MKNEAQTLVTKYAFGIILLVFVSLFFIDGTFLFAEKSSAIKTRECYSNLELTTQNNTLRISEINESMIDQQAASVVCSEVSDDIQNLPIKIWIFLFIVYVALLIFNLSYDFANTKKPRWFFEMLLSVSFVVLWFYYDNSGINIWFPLNIIKVGIVIYLAYLYYLTKNKSKK
ncbi:MAG: hypothetical protein US25_C0031G0007 [Candidatus Moranbacteria bacterium GW2011_GWE1_36_7]|nr:MAG: hypothetical protein UR99_C0044G0007 [Candidatus Moranbacteria bacterium GW2011_GWD2_36_12]KKQ04933.1 MAG: hypothetical protein US16_C0042G0007 [Candidatus Moranbacteria bacterium GW2011_GWE2_36_40]KKQ14057.1 MAG: hypothetical protein US25_C0031G0007 [Candidatus Moranbacteria bacterium GW2011_GWE1_36_7]